MSKWDEFELHATQYLKQKYGDLAKFTHQGGSNANVADILVKNKYGYEFYIEVKMPLAQAGQFVLTLGSGDNNFIFSKNNKSDETVLSDMIINHMNNNFTLFKNAGTAGVKLNIDEGLLAYWILQHYKTKNVEYIISRYEDKEFVIVPLTHFRKYFASTATYRQKKSGSSTPSKKDIPTLISMIESSYPKSHLTMDGKHLLARISQEPKLKNFSFGKYTYYFASKGQSLYEIRRLSNTNNFNVIFSLRLLRGQDETDLRAFINAISKPSL